MRDRLTARVLLFDPQGRILLVRGRATSAPDARSFWFTVGGGVDEGETLEAGALREIAEETGFTEVELGPVVWVRASVFTLADGETVMMKESYFVARCPGGEPSRAAWEPHELVLMDDMRWWSAAEIAATDEMI
jgi:8-oxo-dGTP pyrophosphatase MutT (NUDIX family)